MAVTGASLTPIYDRLHAVSGYHPGGSSLFSDPSLRAGDIVSMVQDGVTYQTPVMVNRTVWKGNFVSNVDSSGEKERPPVEKMAQRKYSGGGGGYRASGRFSSMIDKQDDKISLVVTEQDGQNVVNAASIVLGINGQTGSYVKIQANKIDIDGIVTALQSYDITALDIDCNSLVADSGFITDLYADVQGTNKYVTEEDIESVVRFPAVVYPSGGTLKIAYEEYGGDETYHLDLKAKWMSKTVVTSATITMPSISRSSSRQFLYSDASGNLTPTHTQAGRVITAYTAGSVDVQTDTIYYLGNTAIPSY